MEQAPPGKILTGEEPDLSELVAAFWELLFAFVMGRLCRECRKGGR